MRLSVETAFLEKLSDFGIKLGLDKTVHLLGRLGNPHRRYPSVLIAGTNGKGSVAATLASVLREGGFRTGLYTSPHLLDVRERMAVDGTPISREEFGEGIRRLRRIIEELPYHLYPTYFEALTVIAFAWFADAGVDVTVAEVGMGGRFDATNVLPSTVEVITPISLDHTQYLGRTIGQIAIEKAGIIKRGTAVVSASQPPDALAVVERKAVEKESGFSLYGRDFRGRTVSMDAGGLVFRYRGARMYPALRTPLLGRHQAENVSLAVRAAELLRSRGLPVGDDALVRGVAGTVWPARIQVLRREPLVVLDGAHNPGGIRVLRRSLADFFPGVRFSYLVGILKDKDWRRMLRALGGDGDRFVFTQPENDRAVPAEDLAAAFRGGRPSAETAVVPRAADAVARIAADTRPWCVCGSLYLAGETLKAWRKLPNP